MSKFIRGLMLILFICTVITANSVRTEAAADTKKPKVTLTLSSEKLTNQSISITVKASDASGIKSVKWAKGSKNSAYFKSGGSKLKLSSANTTKVKISVNGTYSFYVQDKASNVTIKTVKVTNIDKTVPTISLKSSNTKPTNKSVKIYLTAADETGISSVKYLAGSKTISELKEKGTTLSLTKNKGSVSVKKNGTYTFLVTDKAKNTTLKKFKVSNIDQTAPVLSADYSVFNQVASVNVKASDASGISKILYVKGKVTDTSSEKWSTSAKEVSNNKFDIKTSGIYSILAADAAGNKTVKQVDIEMELRAVWFSFFEFSSSDYSKSAFMKRVDTMFDNVVDLNMNAVIVHVRPFGDAMYKSSYFPWSAYASGKQGVSPGYDPLEYMVKAAHDRGLEIHAWLNPYRVTTSSTDYSKLSSDNPARKWNEDKDDSNDRNVLSFGGSLYYNPASSEVQRLITNGVTEIVKKYDVDGIHFDDYFYPSLGDKYKTTFDSVEYNRYKEACQKNGKTALTIDNWRRENVNTLVKNVYRAVKKADPSVQFGISPAGNISNLKSVSSYYVDIEKWLSSTDYVDYIAPQIYWTFQNSACPFAETVDRWISLRKSSTVNVYIGIANYRAGSSIEAEWKNSDDVLKRQILYSRDTKKVDGFMFFRYEFFYNKVCGPEVENLMTVLK